MAVGNMKLLMTRLGRTGDQIRWLSLLTIQCFSLRFSHKNDLTKQVLFLGFSGLIEVLYRFIINKLMSRWNKVEGNVSRHVSPVKKLSFWVRFVQLKAIFLSNFFPCELPSGSHCVSSTKTILISQHNEYSLFGFWELVDVLFIEMYHREMNGLMKRAGRGRVSDRRFEWPTSVFWRYVTDTSNRQNSPLILGKKNKTGSIFVSFVMNPDPPLTISQGKRKKLWRLLVFVLYFKCNLIDLVTRVWYDSFVSTSLNRPQRKFEFVFLSRGCILFYFFSKCFIT